MSKLLQESQGISRRKKIYIIKPERTRSKYKLEGKQKSVDLHAHQEPEQSPKAELHIGKVKFRGQ